MSAGCAVVPPDPIREHETSTSAIRGMMAIKRAALLIELQHRHKSLFRDLDGSHPLHPSLSFLLLFQEFALAGDVTPIALCQDVLAHCGYRLASDHLTADRRLNRNLEQLTRDDRLQLLDQLPALDLGFAAMGDEGKRVHRLSGDEHVELDQVAFAEADHLVVHRRVTLRTRLQLVVEVMDDLAQRYFILEHDTVAGPMLELLEGPPAVLGELHHR